MSKLFAARCLILLSIFCAASLFSYGLMAVLPAQATHLAITNGQPPDIFVHDQGVIRASFAITIVGPPIITDDDLWLSADEIDEGDSITLTGVFTPSGANYTHTVTIAWGDNFTDALSLAAGVNGFTLTHAYANNPPPPQTSYPISVTVMNELGGGTAVTSLIVHNVPPSLELGPPAVVQLGQPFSRTATFTDPGDDLWAADVDYGVGEGFQPLPLNPDKSFHLTYLYETAGAYTVTVIVTDNDGGVGQGELAVLVTAVPPTYLPLILRLEAPPPPTDPDWLIYLNQFRAGAGLHPLGENGDWSEGGWLHGRYMVKNDAITHSEDPANPWYSLAGHLAGQNGNVYVSSIANTPDNSAMNFWMTAPFHALPIINPRLYTVGYGSYRESIGLWKMGATLDVRRGRGTLPPDFAYPVMYPNPGGETWLRQFNGFEWPDPLTHCGYTAPAGAPIMLQLGSGALTPQVTGHSLHNGDAPLAHCVFDETTFTHPDPSQQNSGRLILNNQDAIVMMPRNPLIMGETYSVSLTVNDVVYAWSFTVAAAPTHLQPWRGEPFRIGGER
jgi:hypothetical protein